MRENFSNFILNKSSVFKKYSKTKKEEIRYGLECMYTTVTKLLAIITISLILRTLPQLIMLVGLFLPLRFFGFGFHAKNNLQCWIITLIMYSVFPIIIKTFIIPNVIALLIIVALGIVVVLFSPASTEKRPLCNKEKNKKRKVIILVILLIYISAFAFIESSEIKNAIISAVVFQAFLVNPITYKLLG